MKLIESYLTKNDCYRQGSYLKPSCIQIHSIGVPQPSAKKIMEGWNQPGISKMVHAFVEPEGNVYVVMEYNKRPWADAGYGNKHAVTFEMTEPKTIQYTSGANFKNLDPAATRKHVMGTYQTAVEYTACLCQKFGLNPLGKTADGVPVIFSHREGALRGISSNHADPQHLWDLYGLTMDKFRSDVKAKMAGGEVAPDIRPTPEPTPVPTPAPSTAQVSATYRVRTQAHGWLPAVTDYSDYAGWKDSPVTDISLTVSQGSVKYRVHVRGGSWLPWVTGYNINDSNNGYAGNGTPIDALQIYYYTPDSIRPFKKATYQIAPVGGSWYPEQTDTDVASGMEGYAGYFGKSIGKLHLKIQ